MFNKKEKYVVVKEEHVNEMTDYHVYSYIKYKVKKQDEEPEGLLIYNKEGEKLFFYWNNIVKYNISSKPEADALCMKLILEEFKNYVSHSIFKALDNQIWPKADEGHPSIYVITGEYPHIQIDTKYIVEEDEFNYCLREKDTNNISLYPKTKCFDNYENAMNKVLELIQESKIKKQGK